MMARAMVNGLVPKPRCRPSRWAPLLLVLGLAGCASRGVAGIASGQTGTMSVPVGREFMITRDANPSTGYTWRLATPPDPAVLTLVRSEYAPSVQPRPGAPGAQVWTFKTVAPGKVTLVFEYVRPWETDVAPARRDEVTVEVK